MTKLTVWPVLSVRGPTALKWSISLLLQGCDPSLHRHFTNLDGRWVQLQLHKVVNYGMANELLYKLQQEEKAGIWTNCCTSYSRRRKQVSGRPSKGSLMSQKAEKELTQSRHYLPIRNEPKGRRIHSLQTNIQAGQQNAGKW